MLVVTHNIEFSKINLYYTTDLKQNSESLESTLTEFKLDPDTNKYKAHNVEIKLLGMQILFKQRLYQEV